MKKIVSLSILDTVIFHNLPIYNEQHQEIDKWAFLAQPFMTVYAEIKKGNLYFQPEDVLAG